MSQGKSYGKKEATNFKAPVAVQLTKNSSPTNCNNNNYCRDPRNRLLSDSSDELPKGILKNARVPTKRSASECIDDLSQIMADLNLSIEDFSKVKSNGKFCPYHSLYFFDESDEFVVKSKRSDDDDDEDDDYDEDDDDDDEEEEDEDDFDNENHGDDDEAGKNRIDRDDADKCFENSQDGSNERQDQAIGARKIDNKTRDLRKCDCLKNYRDEKPTKSVRFDERVYELKIASRLYDRRAFTKYRLSSRHHPISNQNNSNSSNKKSKNKKKRNRNNQNNNDKNIADGTQSTAESTGSKLDKGPKKQTKSQRAKQSKKAKKKLQSMKRDEHSSTDTSSDDQGYCSSLHCLSD